MEISGFWGTVLEVNALTSLTIPHHTAMSGLPNHPSINSFLGVPLKFGETTIGMIGLANKEAGYNQQDRDDIENLAMAFVEALLRKRQRHPEPRVPLQPYLDRASVNSLVTIGRGGKITDVSRATSKSRGARGKN